MHSKRVFKTRTFERWAKKLLTDALLCAAALEIELGLFEADLGGGVCKKRVALPGQDKSGSTRALVAKRHAHAIFFSVGRSKSDPGTDFTPAQEEAAKVAAKSLQKADVSTLNKLVADGALTEICDDLKDCEE